MWYGRPRPFFVSDGLEAPQSLQRGERPQRTALRTGLLSVPQEKVSYFFIWKSLNEFSVQQAQLQQAR
ncbi:hypothetical protein [Scytonema sp. NUACC26]|uniref:hypothetical protein n=1 Tax=Scytonema sp. NUACC26 TaxID=3140176 RepID=UPI0038B39A9F